MFEAEFELNDDIVYLNHAAVSPWPARTRRAVCDFATENARLGAARYPEWLVTEASLRKRLRNLINAASVDEIAMLKSTSEALSVIAYGIDWREGDTVVTFDEEFPSNRMVWESLSSRGVSLESISVHQENPEDALLALCGRQTRLVTVSSVQYANGYRCDLEKIGNFCRERNILLCVDAIQSLGAFAFDVQEIGADFVVADGHKWMMGPEGLALFYCRSELIDVLRLNQYGWHMTKFPGRFDIKDWELSDSATRFECGSPNMLGIHALNASLSLIEDVGMEIIQKNVLTNTRYLIDSIKEHSSLELNSPDVPERCSGIVNFLVKGIDSSQVYEKLMKNNVICTLRGNGIRFSPHFYQNHEDLDQSIKIIEKSIK